MKKIFSVILAVSLLISGVVFADMQYQSNGTNVGVATKENVKGCTTTRSGQIVTVDCTSVASPTISNATLSGVITASGLLRPTGGVNWNDLPALYKVSNYAMNWTDIQNIQRTLTGINWNDLDTVAGGVNWMKISNNAAVKSIACWRTDGQLGQCATSVSGVTCTACN